MADAQAEEAITRARYYYGISTFVLGLAPASDATAIATLNQMAENGGEASAGTPNLFATPATIDAQVAAISPSPPTSTGNPCEFALPYPISPGTSLAVSITTGTFERLLIWRQSDGYSYIAFGYVCDGRPPGRSSPSAP